MSTNIKEIPKAAKEIHRYKNYTQSKLSNPQHSITTYEDENNYYESKYSRGVSASDGWWENSTCIKYPKNEYTFNGNDVVEI